MPYTSKIANMLLYNPFDNKASLPSTIGAAMTPDVFFRECYVRPIFLSEKTDLVLDSLETEAIQGSEDSDYKISYEEFLDLIKIRKMEFSYFYRWIRDFRAVSNSETVYTISGNAGTGKTTLVNYMRNYCTKGIKWVVLDISASNEYIYWPNSERTRIDGFNLAFGKVFSTITEKVANILFDAEDNSIPTIDRMYERLAEITRNYTKYFSNSIMSSCKLIEALSDIINNYKSKRDCVIEAANFCANYFTNMSSELKLNIDVAVILETLMYVLRCTSGGFDNNYLIVFDNIERFIQQDEIFNSEVHMFRMNLVSFANAINRAFSVHKGHFKFIMVVRTSTARMVHIRQHSADGIASDINIDESCDVASIINRRLNWYSKCLDLSFMGNSSEVDSSIKEIKLVRHITNDFRKTRDGHLTGLKPEIESLFNNNNRLIIDFIGTLVESRFYSKSISDYEEYVTQDTSLSRFAARSIIRGLILDSLERQDNLFIHLKEYDPIGNKIGVGDARKLLTILYNDSNESGSQGMRLSKVLAKLYNVNDVEAVWNSDDYDYRSKREEIASTLFYMNSYNRRDNNWIQFVDIRIAKKAKSQVVIASPDELESVITQYMNRIDLYLMPAGKAYLNYIVSSFEFFSLKSGDSYTPLFSLVPTPLDMIELDKGSVKTLRCYRTIRNTVDYTIRNLEVLRFEDDMQVRIGEKTLYHAERIRNAHKNYLTSFCRIIRERYIDFNHENYGYNMELNSKITSGYFELIHEVNLLRKRYE